MRRKPSADNTPIADSADSARAAGLRYYRDDCPGLRRMCSGNHFRYVDSSSRAVRDSETLQRIRSLVIPPAWENVWICPIPNGHLQATGRDARGRKQYRYHLRWREIRDETKYDRMIAFGLALPEVRARTEADLARPGLPRPKVLAAVVRLLETTLIRVGNEEYARTNHSFGLTTLRDRHVEVHGASMHFTFRGKSGVRHAVDVSDRRLARIIRNCQEMPGHELFQFMDHEGATHIIDSADVNAYLHEIAGTEFTAKDFRTWAGTVLAAVALWACEECDSVTGRKRNVVAAVVATAGRLGNTVAVCRKCYVHPAIFEAYLEGSFTEALPRPAPKNGSTPANQLREEETAVLVFLQQRAHA